MKYHLAADVKHDFGAEFPYAPEREALGAINEDAVVNYFIPSSLEARAGAPGYAVLNDQAEARLRGQIVFTIPEETSAFKSWMPPVLSPTQNTSVGIVQDAGHFITLQLQCKNVITFGSILDPARKPIAPDRLPIWYDPGPGASLSIPLNVFGFNPTVITALKISELTAGTVKASYGTPARDNIDAVSMGLQRVPPSVKSINDVNVATAGFFTSIAKAENLKIELRIAGVPSVDAFIRANRDYFYIGKTLGDVSLVASAMPSIGDVPNPYAGIPAAAPGAWKWWAGAPEQGPPNPAAPSVLMLKTGDRLNWVRAIVLGVGAIYEDQPKGARTIVQYKFFPANVDPAAIKDALLDGFDTIAADVGRRYDGVIAELDTVIASGVTNFSHETTPTLIKPAAAVAATNLIIAPLKIELEALKDRVIAWVNRRRTEATMDLPRLRVFYEETRVRANACSPSGTIFLERGELRSLSPKVIVANVPSIQRGAAAGPEDWPISISIDISMRNAFVRLNNSPDGSVDGTDFDKRFLKRLPALVGGAIQYGGDDNALDLENINTMILKGIGEIEDIEVIDGMVFGDATALEQFPLLRDFAVYSGGHLPHALSMIRDAAQRPARLADPLLLKNMKDELDGFSEYYTQTSRRNIFDGLTGVINPDKSSIATFQVNAYSCKVNARNSKMFGDQEKETESSRDFEAFESAYIDILKLGDDLPSEIAAAVARELGDTDMDVGLSSSKAVKMSEDTEDDIVPNVLPSSAAAAAAGAPAPAPDLAAVKNRLMKRGRDEGMYISNKSMKVNAETNPTTNFGFQASAAGGGLRERRPLYSNVRPVDVPVQPPSDEGLRQRRRTRRARRVRKSTGKSRRGGNRDDVGGV